MSDFYILEREQKKQKRKERFKSKTKDIKKRDARFYRFSKIKRGKILDDDDDLN